MNPEPNQLFDKPVSTEAFEHLLGVFQGGGSRRTLIVLGSIHGNEISGKRAIERIVPKLAGISEHLNGRVVLIAGNKRAINAGKRFIDADLNRHFTAARLKARSAGSSFHSVQCEDLEMSELLEIFEIILETAAEEVFAIDLHSTSAGGSPFGTVGDTMRNRDFALRFPITFLLGIEEQLDGTILEYLNNRGTVTLGFEAGQHVAESSIDNHEALIWWALVNSLILSKEAVEDLSKYEKVLSDSTGGRRVLEVRYRHPVKPDDEFEMLPGFENFQPVKRGQHLAKDRNGPVKSPETGLIMMPLYQKLGEDGFFIAREVSPFWLGVSRLLRTLKIPSLIHLMPGVRSFSGEDGAFEVNTRIARFFPLQIFHLLGFRKRRWHQNKLVVSKRKYDTKSPF